MSKEEDTYEDDYEQVITTGFDRGVDYEPMKDKFIETYKKIANDLAELKEEDKSYVSKRRILIHKLIYLTIAMIQLRNGSRIIEAIKAFRLFLKNPELIEEDKRVTVKLAKSESIKYKKDTGEEFTTKPRFREMKFPNTWIGFNLSKDMRFYAKYINNISMRKRVLDYLLQYFNCNTHSLRYACINYLIYHEKRELNDVAKFVGHTNLSQLVRYTQIKNSNKIFDLDI